ncbi:TNT domain-containing protein [Flavobacterium sp.]|uniref:TNT domain-containing protein n=1 Tax=Flavobacterium sp. TaxID=239 RepID=UPI003750EF44
MQAAGLAETKGSGLQQNGEKIESSMPKLASPKEMTQAAKPTTFSKVTTIDGKTSWKTDGFKSQVPAEYYPQNNGAMQGTTQSTVLEAGTKIDRFGSEAGKFFSPEGTELQLRALPPGNNGNYNVYEVLKPFPVQSSIIAPAFNQVGTGTQYLAPISAKYLKDFGYIIKVN